MRRRAQDDKERRLAIPADIASGPEVGRWASPGKPPGAGAAAGWPSDKAGREARRDAIWDCMSSARRRWWRARDAWAAEAGYTRSEGWVRVPTRVPYWGSGG